MQHEGAGSFQQSGGVSVMAHNVIDMWSGEWRENVRDYHRPLPDRDPLWEKSIACVGLVALLAGSVALWTWLAVSVPL